MRPLPPEATRFKKGQSGNPKGRPKKAKPTLNSSSGGGITDRINEFALKEAMRLITVREGNKVETLPAVQAVLRSMYADAARGNAKTQRQILELLKSAEASRVSVACANLEKAIEYKEKWSQKFAEAERDGKPMPDVHPHPADIKIDEDGTVTIDGPLTREQAGAFKVLEEHSMRSLVEHCKIKAQLQLDPNNQVLKAKFERLDRQQKLLLESSERRISRLAYAQSILGHEIDLYARDDEEIENDATK